MTAFSALLLLSIGLSLAIQGWLVFGFVKLLQRPRESLLPDDQCPEAVVVLCLRGGDPFLHRCVAAILRQDYPRFRIIFVVDHQKDPSLNVLRSILNDSSASNYEIQFLSKPLSTCSLKCSSLLQAYRSLNDSVDFLAQLDADTVPHPTWLRELATGLATEGVGAVTGNRWYAPDEPRYGALVRHVWNAAAIVQMAWYRIAWGGTLAIKLSTIRQAKLDERWSHSLCEDTMLASQLADIGQRIAFSPNLIMVNREDCDIRSFIPWVTRQLLTARLYHRAWPLVLVHGIASAAILVLGWLWALSLLFLRDFAHAAAVAFAMFVFQFALVFLVLWIGKAVEASLARQGRFETWNKPRFRRWVWIVTLTQYVYSKALVRCILSRSTLWRGIWYDVDGPWGIKLRRYQPYIESTPSIPTGSTGSL